MNGGIRNITLLKGDSRVNFVTKRLIICYTRGRFNRYTAIIGIRTDTDMPECTDGYVYVDGLKIHYYRTGGRKPPVVINHGGAEDGLCMTRVARELEQEYDVILPDARGHGRSACGKGDYSVKQRVADLAGLIQELKLERPAVGGHSMGAETAAILASDAPNLVRGVFLEEPPIILAGEKLGDGTHDIKMDKLVRFVVRSNRMFRILPKFIDLYLARKASPAYPDVEVLPWVDSKKRLSFDFLNSLPNMGMILSDPLTVFKKITVPVLLFIGDKAKGSIVSREAAQKIEEVNSKIQVVHLEGASHDIRRTRFDGYMPALKKFLSSL
jgi:pimeloyl-ACP methyl ester carboxylesterase